VGGQNEVAEYLVTYYQDPIALADSHYSFHFSLIPHPSGGVVGVAEEHEFASLCLFLQVGEVNIVAHLIARAFLMKTALNRLPSEVLGDAVVVVVDGREQ
jgi:hypothetical protein